MILPREFRINGKKYKVIQRKCMRTLFHQGCFYTGSRRIEIGLHSALRKRGEPHGRAYSTEEIGDTFWHEVTHAILHDMDHPLWRDESFVDAFGQRLHEVVRSARL